MGNLNSDANALMLAYKNLIQSLAFGSFADDFVATAAADIQSGKRTKDEVVEDLFKASLYYRLSALSVDAARDMRELGFGLPGAAVPKDAPVASVGEFFRRAAEANMSLLETQFIEVQAKTANVRPDVLRNTLADKDTDYLLAVSEKRVLGGLQRYFGEGEPLNWARLGGALSSYGRASGLVAKYISFDVQLDDDFNVTGINNEKALINALDLADEQARHAIGLLKTNGMDVGMFAAGYENGRLSREGSVDDKLDALSSFWNAYIAARAIAYLGKFAKLDK